MSAPNPAPEGTVEWYEHELNHVIGMERKARHILERRHTDVDRLDRRAQRIGTFL